MKRIRVRFRNVIDIINLSKNIGLDMNEHTKEVNLTDKIITKTYKQTSKKDNGNTRQLLKEHWKDMPEFDIDFKRDYLSIIDFMFEDTYSTDVLSQIFEQQITDRTKSIWFPRLNIGENRNLRVIGGENPIYPVYVVSKGRYERRPWHTSLRLSQMGIYHYLVVEPQELELYKKNFYDKYVKVIPMDLKYKDEYDCFNDLGNKESTGPGAVRNFCWEHSIENGFEYHWVLDDNIKEFDRFWRGHRILCRTGEVFRSCERFVERYSNIAIGGLNYKCFVQDNTIKPPIIINSRVYSILLIKNDIPYRWRGRYNEDTDLSLRVLKGGLCTVQFNLFVGDKLETQTVGGGNTEEFYSKEGTWAKSQMLVDMHPDVTQLVTKYGRPHHLVDYSSFKKQLKLELKKDIVLNDGINERGMKIIRIPEEMCNTEKDNAEYLIEHFYKEEKDIIQSDMFK